MFTGMIPAGYVRGRHSKRWARLQKQVPITLKSPAVRSVEDNGSREPQEQINTRKEDDINV